MNYTEEQFRMLVRCGMLQDRHPACDVCGKENGGKMSGSEIGDHCVCGNRCFKRMRLRINAGMEPLHKSEETREERMRIRIKVLSHRVKKMKNPKIQAPLHATEKDHAQGYERRCLVFRNREWVQIACVDLKRGDIYKLFESDGTAVKTKKGKATFFAVSDTHPLEECDGVLGVDSEIVRGL